MTGRLTKDEILQKYPDKGFHERLLRLRCLADFLDASIVADDYEVAPRLTAPIRLTQAGADLLKRLQSNANPRNTCILAIFLTLWWDELLVDPVGTQVDDLLAQVSNEVSKGNVKHPYLYGHLLYDKAFEDLNESKKILSHKETEALLGDTPAGVFQLMDYVTGPYGVLASREFRFAPPRPWIPLYHCEDLSCGELHESFLTTGNSKISKVRIKLREVLERKNSPPSDWDAIFQERISERINPFSWTYSAGLVPLLGDAFSIREMRAILADLLDSANGELRTRAALAGLKVASAPDFVESLNEAEALQLILLCTDDHIRDSLDTLILTGKIKIPSAEVRTSVIEPQYSGYFNIEPECSSLGLRSATRRSLTLLRTRHLVSMLFNTSDDIQRERLRWLIRGAEGDTFQERLDRFICQQDLEKAIHSLSFDSERNRDIAAGFAGLGTRARELLTDETKLSRAITWRLGVADVADDSHLTQFREYGERLRQLAMRTHIYSLADQQDIRAVAVNYFVTLEKLLSDYVKLAAWSLLRDHYASPDGFTYHVEEATGFCADIIARQQPDFELSEDGKWTLFPLIHSFGTLARRLGELTFDKNMRPNAEYPHILRNTSPYSFLFRHKYPFLDLSEEARARIIAILKEATSKLSGGRVDEVRNLTQHNSLKFPTQNEILAAISAAETVLSEAEEAGLLPVTALPVDQHDDSFGRRFITLGTRRRKTTLFIRPSEHFLTGLPPLVRPQLIIRAAVYDNSTEVIRLAVQDMSDYAERWANFPRRRRPMTGKISGDAGTVLET